jgi:hypothetical protein
MVAFGFDDRSNAEYLLTMVGMLDLRVSFDDVKVDSASG